MDKIEAAGILYTAVLSHCSTSRLKALNFYKLQQRKHTNVFIKTAVVGSGSDVNMYYHPTLCVNCHICNSHKWLVVACVYRIVDYFVYPRLVDFIDFIISGSGCLEQASPLNGA